jgi:hypothetical protein
MQRKTGLIAKSISTEFLHRPSREGGKEFQPPTTHTMKTIQKMRHCEICGHPTLHLIEDRSPNHILHLLLSILTGGLWIVVWLCLAFTRGLGAPACIICGSAMSKERKEEIKQWAKSLSFGGKWKRFFGWENGPKAPAA